MFYRCLDACSGLNDGRYRTDRASCQSRTVPGEVQPPKPPRRTQPEIVVASSCRSLLSVQTPSVGRVQSAASNWCRRRSPRASISRAQFVGGLASVQVYIRSRTASNPARVPSETRSDIGPSAGLGGHRLSGEAIKLASFSAIQLNPAQCSMPSQLTVLAFKLSEFGTIPSWN